MSVQRALLVLLCCAFGAAWAEVPDWSGYLSLEPRVFVDDRQFSEQPAAGISPSAVMAPVLRYEWNRGDDRLTFAPYVRWDADDDERTHADLREALWLHVDGSWTWRIGVGRVFWGVTESRHLVDIVNQTDFVEDIDEEDKLGQPMIAVERWTANAGTFGVFLLPGFRERTFPAGDARLRGPVPIDSGRAEYESDDNDRRLDLALRWTQIFGYWDIGLSAFYGTSREPRLLPRLDASGNPILIPRYDVIGQIGIDLQFTKGAWLWKLEAIGRQGHGKTFGAAVAGVEYTLFGVGESGADLGLLAEYLYDGRDHQAPPTIYDKDWFAGFRLALNDTQGTSVLGGVIVDSSGTLAIVEAERRLTRSWTVEAEVRWFIDVDPRDLLLDGVRQDSFIMMRLARYL